MLRIFSTGAGLIALTMTLNSWAVDFLRHGSWVSGADGGFTYSASTLGVGRNQGTSLRLIAAQGDCDRLSVEGATALAKGHPAPLPPEIGEFEVATQIDGNGIRRLRAIGRFDDRTRRVLWMLKPEDASGFVHAMRAGSLLRIAAPALSRATSDGAFGELSLDGSAVALDRVRDLCVAEESTSLRLDLSQQDAESMCSAYLSTRADHKNESYRFRPLKGDHWNATLSGALNPDRGGGNGDRRVSCYFVKRSGGWTVAGASVP